MRILIAPDKFKGALDAREVAENLAHGIRDSLPAAKIDIAPMADGGEGTAEVICNALGGSWMKCKAHDPLDREIEARYAWIDQRKLAVMEMSEAAGMRRLQPNEYDPDRASTFGVGEMILDAAKRGANEIIIGLGGSATNDGGFGMARALGFHFCTSISLFAYLGARLRGRRLEVPELTGPVSELQMLETIKRPKTLALPNIVAAVDVQNPLYGENGATRIFGPQKGVKPNQVEQLDIALIRLSDMWLPAIEYDYANKPGAGAAGGLGFGLMSFCGAKIQPGFEIVAEAVGLEAKIRNVDLVITGEGSLDRQTLSGKTPAGVAKLARKLGRPVYAVAGRATEDQELNELFDKIYVVGEPGLSEKENMARAAELLQKRGRDIGASLSGRA
jgi:glycerate kinase